MLVLAATAAAAAPAAPDDAAARFGTREAVEQVSISPDGSKVSLILATPGRGNSVNVVDLKGDGSMRTIANSTGRPARFTRCMWMTDARVACGLVSTVDGGQGRIGYTRYFAYDSDGGNAKMLSTRTNDRSLGIMQDGGTPIDWMGPRGDGSRILMTREHVAEQGIGRVAGEKRGGLGVDAVDVANLSRVAVEPPRTNAADYIADGRGRVRIMGIWDTRAEGNLTGRVHYSYRTKDSREWKELGTADVGSGVAKGFTPVAVDPELDAVYGFDTVDGRRALVRIKLDGSMAREVVLARPDVDVDHLVQLGRQQRVVGVSYATDRRAVGYFDPKVDAVFARLAKAFPGKQIGIVDASADEGTLVVSISSDVDPGRYYLYSTAGGRLSELLPIRPGLAGTNLAPVRAITYKAADGTEIPAYLTLPPGGTGKGLPAIVLPHGGPAARDEWGFDWLVQFLAQQGFAVLQPQFRGSAGYGDAWFKDNGFRSWRTAVGDVNDAGRYLIGAGIAAPGKLAVLGWSYGGYAALQSAVLDPQLFKAIVAVAPATDLDLLRRQSLNRINYLVVDRFIGHGEHVRSGSPAQNAAGIAAPVLLFHGATDDNVEVEHSRLMASRLRAAGKPVEIVEYPDLDHYLNDDAARADLLRRTDAFLRKTLGM